MRLSALCLAFFAIAIFAPASAYAASAYSPLREDLQELNRIKPLQNPKYESGNDVLKRRVLDRKNKVVGSIQDGVMNKNGNIAALDIKFDRLQLNRPVLVNYNSFEIGTVSNGYAMESLDSGQIRDLYPQLLAEIETAAGESDEAQGIRNLQGKDVYTTSGRRIGKLEDILFEGNGRRAAAVYIVLNGSNMSTTGIAIPFRQIDFSTTATTAQVVVTDELAEAITAYNKSE